jgi:hypothetical protein
MEEFYQRAPHIQVFFPIQTSKIEGLARSLLDISGLTVKMKNNLI